MKNFIIAIAIVAMGLTFAPVADAGCGKKNATVGKLTKYDAATKSLTIRVRRSSDPEEVEAKKAKLSMTPDSKVIIEEGKKIDSLVGTEVTVVSEHGKIDFVIPMVTAK